MPLLRERALIIFEEDVRDAEVLKKLRARIVTQMLPPYRYDRPLTAERSLLLEGRESPAAPSIASFISPEAAIFLDKR